jgi:hypothetical protein
VPSDTELHVPPASVSGEPQTLPASPPELLLLEPLDELEPLELPELLEPLDEPLLDPLELPPELELDPLSFDADGPSLPASSPVAEGGLELELHASAAIPATAKSPRTWQPRTNVPRAIDVFMLIPSPGWAPRGAP